MQLEGRLDNPSMGEEGGARWYRSLSNFNFLAGNSADYREIDQTPLKDSAVCVSDMSKDNYCM